MGSLLKNWYTPSVPLSKILLGLLAIGSITLTSCGSSGIENTPPPAKLLQPEAKADSNIANKNANKPAPPSDTESVAMNLMAKPTVPMPQKPQLIRTADISLRLESIDKMVVQVRRLVQSKQGDIYNFQDNRPQENGQRRQANLVLKVPSTAFDDTLTEIGKLGQIQGQTIKSDDVTQQLVDSTARLKNLRQQEELTRKIMERSGSVSDILAVSQSLSEIREQIEQLDATAKNLRQQVAYSTINLKVEESQSANPAGDGLGVQAEETWKNSTRAAGGLVTNIGLTLLWLVPFTPFLALGAGGFYYYTKRRRHPQPTIEVPSEE
jgi:Domain of unknown function (DUF4349)